MTREELEGIEVRLRAATPGPWKTEKGVYDRSDVHYWINAANGSSARKTVAWLTGGLGEYTGHRKPEEYKDDPEILADATFIAHAPEDVEALLAEVARLRAGEGFGADVEHALRAELANVTTERDDLAADAIEGLRYAIRGVMVNAANALNHIEARVQGWRLRDMRGAK